MPILRDVLGRIATVWALLGGAILMTIVLATVFNVGALAVARVLAPLGLGPSGVAGYDDFVRLLVSAAALMLFPYCQLQRGHVAVDLLFDRFSARLQRRLETLWLLAMAAVAAFLFYWMVQGMLDARSFGTVAAVLGWAEWPFYLPGLLSVALWAAVALNDAVLSARGLNGQGRTELSKAESTAGPAPLPDGGQNG